MKRLTDIQRPDFESFFEGFLECIQWAGIMDDTESGEPSDKAKSANVTKAAVRAMKKDCLAFFEENFVDLCEYAQEYQPSEGYDPWECAGHDFYLTRCGHGAGFWDRGLGELGDRLSKASKAYGSCYLEYHRGYLHFLEG